MSLTAEKLKELGLTLPLATRPIGSYVPWTRSGNLIFISGQLPMVEGKPHFVGRLGDKLGVEDGLRAAQISALNVIAQLDDACGNDLDQVKQIVKITGFVAATAEFTEHPKVVNGASDLFVKIFGERGPHARSAVGVASLPLGVCVEVEAIIEVT